MLVVYDSNQDLQTDVLRSFHDGKIGGADLIKVYIKNDDVSKYYVSLKGNIELDLGEYDYTSWSTKLIAGERQPTEAEWNRVVSGLDIDLPDIGDIDAADTSTYYPIWIRIYAPGSEGAQIRKTQKLKITGLEKTVGAP